MLLQFKVGNYLSFKDVVVFSMVASSSKKEHEENVFEVNNKLRLLKSAVIYGANASGKSNLLKAMKFARLFIISSSKETQIEQPIDVVNFKLSTETENKPSFFEFVFIVEGMVYRYGFEADKKEITHEWLYYIPKNREVRLFDREKAISDDIENTSYGFIIGSDFKEGKELTEKTRPNALFLSVVAQFNGAISTKILNWFWALRIILGLNDRFQTNFTSMKLEEGEDESFKNKLLNFLKCADVGIENLSIDRKELDMKPSEPILAKGQFFWKATSSKIKTTHKKFDKEGNFISQENFDFDVESEGTKKLFAISGPIFDALERRRILIIDEFDSRLHPLLTQFVIKLFNSNVNNPNNAQLIFASHDTSYLNKEFFRRDQVWFTEKDKYGATDLYSLAEYKKVRKDASFSKDYFLGKYGAIPNIKEIRNLMK